MAVPHGKTMPAGGRSRPRSGSLSRGVAQDPATLKPRAEASTSKTVKITVQSPLPSGDRIYKPDIRKAAEVRVGGDHRQAMLQGERRQVGVGHMLRAKPCRTQQVPQDFPVARRWARHPDRLAAQPLVYLPPRRGHAHGPFEDPLIADKPHESEQARPWQTERNRLAQPLVQPGPRPLMLGERCRECLDQDIRVYEPHRYPSPSAAASADATSSTFGRRHRPRSTGWVQYGAGGRGSCIPTSPRRNASFTTSLSGLSRARRSCLIRAATSSSRDSVVLIHRSIIAVMP